MSVNEQKEKTEIIIYESKRFKKHMKKLEVEIKNQIGEVIKYPNSIIKSSKQLKGCKANIRQLKIGRKYRITFVFNAKEKFIKLYDVSSKEGMKKKYKNMANRA